MEITWRDHAAHAGWISEAKLFDDPICTCVTAGYILGYAKDKGALVVASNRDRRSNNSGDCMAVLVECIVDIQVLKPAP